MGIYLTSEEVDALFDCSEKRLKNRDRAAYLYMRERMDSATLRTVVGWKGISVAIEEVPVQGSTEKPFRGTREAIRWILRRLEEKNLIKQETNEKLAESVFSFPLHDRTGAPEKRGTIEEPWKWNQESNHELINKFKVLTNPEHHESNHPKNAKSNHYPILPKIKIKEDSSLPTLSSLPDDSTQGERSDLPGDAITHPTLSSQPKSGKTRPTYPEAFLQAVAAYPARHTSIDKSAAYRSWNARIREGHAAEAILAGIERYHRFVIAEGNLGTKYIKMMSTFLGPADPPFFTLPWHISGKSGISRGTDGHYDQVDYRSGATDLEDVAWLVEEVAP
ncbi:MAG: hypothetical protein HQM01_08150 [Magnetococcales bacterium]|nr:hypothetical protein [Magnetococcales bacterium]